MSHPQDYSRFEHTAWVALLSLVIGALLGYTLGVTSERNNAATFRAIQGDRA